MKYTVEYLDDLPDGIGAKCYYPFLGLFGLGTCKIILRPKYKNDKGILNHELKHAEQYSKYFFHAPLYMISQNYRYECELEAYAEQIKEYKYTTLHEAKWIINALVNKYDLYVGLDIVEQDVKNIINQLNKKRCDYAIQ